MKAFANDAKRLIRRELQAKAAQEGVEVRFHCGPYEILRIVKESVDRLKQVTMEENLVLAAARRNGMLAWRPNLATGKLERPDDQAWCKGLPKCGESHRLKKSWSDDRYKWVNGEGEPVAPDWSKSSQGKSMEDQCDLAALANPDEVKLINDDEWKGPANVVDGHRYEETQVMLGVFEDVEPAISEDVSRAAFLQMTPKKRLLDMEVSALLTPQKVSQDPTTVKKRAAEKKNAIAAKAYLSRWRAQSRKQIANDGISRLELMEQLVPVAGTKAKDNPAKQAVKAFMEKSTKARCRLIKNN